MFTKNWMCVVGVFVAMLTAMPAQADVITNCADDFIAGPTAQTATNMWQYFEITADRSTPTLLSNWRVNNSVPPPTYYNTILPAFPQWDQGQDALGNVNPYKRYYPWVLKIDQDTDYQSPNATASYPFKANKLYMHPGSGLDTVAVAVGWYNNTGETVTVSYDITWELGEPVAAYDGVRYYEQRGLVGDARYLSLGEGAMTIASHDPDAHSVSGVEVLAGEMLYFVVDNGTVGNFNWDHTMLDVTITAVTGEVPEPSTLALLSIGMASLLCYAWRKRK